LHGAVEIVDERGDALDCQISAEGQVGMDLDVICVSC